MTYKSIKDRQRKLPLWITCGMDIGSRLRRARKAAGYSQEAIGALFASNEKPEGFGKATVSAWETGRNELTASQIVKLCQILRIDVDFLLLGKESALTPKESWIIDAYRSADATGRTVIETGVEMSVNLRGAGSLAARATPISK